MPSVSTASVRRACLADLEAIASLEQRCFDLDRQSRRSLRYLIERANAAFLVWPDHGMIGADVIVLFRARTRVARVYSIAVDSSLRGRGVGLRLLACAQAEARARGCNRLRAEVRADNRASRLLFARAGFDEIEPLIGYYPGAQGARADGIRLEQSWRA